MASQVLSHLLFTMSFALEIRVGVTGVFIYFQELKLKKPLFLPFNFKY